MQSAAAFLRVFLCAFAPLRLCAFAPLRLCVRNVFYRTSKYLLWVLFVQSFSKYADSCFFEKVFSAALCVSRQSSAVKLISPQSALRYAE
jgi:hypothetical protein